MVLNFRSLRLRLARLLAPKPRAVGPLSSVVRESPDTGWTPQAYGNYYATSSLVYSAIKIRADAITRPLLRVYRNMRDAKEPQPNHPLQQLLDKANPYWTRSDLWRATSTYLDLWGSAYWWLKGGPGIPTEIWPLRPDRMKAVVNKAVNPLEQVPLGWLYDYQGRRIPLAAEEIIWFRQFNPLDSYAGLSPIAPVRLSIDTAQDATRHNRNAFRNDLLTSRLAIGVEGTLTEDEVTAFYERLKERYAKPENSWRPMILSGGAEFKELGFSPREMEHILTLRWSLEDIARVYGVPKIMLQDLEKATYANFDAAERVFWRSVAVYLQSLQDTINEYLVPRFGDDIFVEFDLSQIEALQPNQTEMALRQREDVKTGIITINEVRAERNLEPVPWGDEPPVAPAPLGAAMPAAASVTARDFSPNGHRRWHNPALSEAALDKMSEMFIRRMTLQEKRFDQLQRRLFAEQEQAIIRKLRSLKSITRQKNDLFDEDAYIEEWLRRATSVYSGAVSDSGQAQAVQHGLGPFNPATPSIKNWLKDRTLFWAKRVNEETGRLLAAELDEAISLGESIKQIQGRVEKVFRFSDVVRSERIARTETGAAMNFGVVESYKQSGVVEAKMWLATADERTREGHREAHMQVVPLEADFFVMNEHIPHPGAGSPGNAINCRCTTVPVLSEKAQLAEIIKSAKE